ncbi:MAG: hypothetical protein ACPGWR_31565 [Ardenticatenaceae bacterium]
MPKLTYKGSLPPREEFRQSLAQAIADTNPVDDLLQLSGQLREYEQTHQLSSADFFQKYQAGTLDEPLQHCAEWAATYNLFMKIKRTLEATLMRAAIYPEREEVYH